ncbi:hypothetical protein [Bosea sp. AS-1]|uniref:hypothetical protein n=1 Tax=Bosea sp. AS-1 TaxID=2015316 RepID=UPI000B77FBB0|nr:hypothetical protein [Bosea sp. AS-1]
MTLSALIARVEEGTASSAELDGAIFDALSGPGVGSAREAAIDRRERPNWLPRYTTSLDSVLSLIEQKLPGWSWSVHRDQAEEEGRQHWATVAEPWAHGRVIETAFLTSPARALLCACLHALEDGKADLADATNGDRPAPKASP